MRTFFMVMLASISCAVFFHAAHADTTVTCPDIVPRGDAFLVEVCNDTDIESVIFVWRKQKFSIASSTASTGNSKNTLCQILLPVPLEETADQLELSVISVNSSGKQTNRFKKTIGIATRERPVQKLSVLPKYVNPPAEQMERIKNDRLKVRAALQAALSPRMWSLPLTRPVVGAVSSKFGMKRIFNGQPRNPHKGLDLRGKSGEPVVACADGKVVLVDDLYFSGNVVYIHHGDGVVSAYLHLSEAKVGAGDNVTRGQIIGLVGSTGRVTGPHLHFSVMVQGHSIDPEPLLSSIE